MNHRVSSSGRYHDESLLESAGVAIAGLPAMLERHGFRLEADGTVREFWREWADGKWLDWTKLVPSHETEHWVRIENGVFLEVWKDCDGYSISVDQRRVGELVDVEEAKAQATRRALDMAIDPAPSP